MDLVRKMLIQLTQLGKFALMMMQPPVLLILHRLISAMASKLILTIPSAFGSMEISGVEMLSVACQLDTSVWVDQLASALSATKRACAVSLHQAYLGSDRNELTLRQGVASGNRILLVNVRFVGMLPLSVTRFSLALKLLMSTLFQPGRYRLR